MAETRSFPVAPDFDLNSFLPKLAQLYGSKGFQVNVQPFGEGAIVRFSKDDDGGIKKFVGLALGINANFSFTTGMNGQKVLMVSFTDAEWTGKIIGLAVGWIFCAIPFFIALYGAVKQSELPNTIASDIMLLLRGGPGGPYMNGTPYGANPGMNGNPYGNNPGANGAPYGTNPGANGNPYGTNPGANNNPNNNPNGGNPQA